MPERHLSRVILKLSGEMFASPDDPINFDQYSHIAAQVIDIRKETGVKMAMVVGGGNIFRGRTAGSEVDRSEADTMGMMATIINGVGLREALVRLGETDTRLMTSIRMPEVGEPFIRLKARHHLDEGRIIIISGGLGKPYFSTDSAVAQYAGELGCEMIFKASTVDGVYDLDPRINIEAQKFDSISFKEAINRRLKVMDTTAFAMCEELDIPILVFASEDLPRLPEAIRGQFDFGTVIRNN